MTGKTTLTAHTGKAKLGMGFIALAALLIPHVGWMVLLLALGGAWLGAYIWVKALQRGLSAERTLQANWVAINDTLVEHFEIDNQSWLPTPFIEIADNSTIPGYRPAFAVTLKRKTKETWRQTAICSRRGRYQLGPWTLNTGDPFGLYTLTTTYDEVNEIIIHPPIYAHTNILLPAGDNDGTIPHRKQNWRAQQSASSVRRYQPSDPLRRIHWPTTARYNKLYTRTFEQDAAGDVWILLDLNEATQLGNAEDSTEEQTIILAATLVAQSLNARRAIGLAAYSQTPVLIAPSHGTQQQWRLMEVLATVMADADISLTTMIRDVRHATRRGAAIQIITATDEVDWLPALHELRQAGVSASVVLLDRESYGGTGNTAQLQASILKLGLPCDIMARNSLQKLAVVTSEPL